MSAKNQVFNLRTLLWSPTPPWMRSVRDPIKRQTKKELKLVNLTSVKRLHFQFDPFHENVDSIRQFLVAVSNPKIRKTNPKCGLKTDIVCKREEPTLIVSHESGRRVVFKTSLLSTLEIAENYNKILNKLNQTTEELIKN